MEIANNSVLHLKFEGPTPELTDNIAETSVFALESIKATGLNDVRRLIRAAKNDSKIKAIFIQTEMPQLSPSAAFELVEVLKEFKESGKPIMAYGDYFTQSGYALASTADSVFLNPNGLIDARGYGMVIPYMEDFTEKTTIEFDVYHAGKYKSAIEPYYRSESSDENRYQSRVFLQHYQQMLNETIAKNRGLSVEDVNSWIVEGRLNNADDARTAGFVDGLKYYDDFKAEFELLLDEKKLNLVSIHEYLQANPKDSKDNKNKIAIIYAEGTVAQGTNQRGEINLDIYEEVLDRIEKNNKIKAVVLRVNSPGGSAFTSDVFWKKIEDIKASGKPVIASFGDYAASGGYYIAAGADHIVSEPTTLTGSIGVFSMLPDLDQFFRDKIGVNWDTIGTGKNTFLYSLMVNRSEADNRLLQSETERIYAQFKRVVSKGRNMSPEQIEEIAQGRVWSGIDAINVGLVDQIGGIDDAIAVAAKKANIEEYKILEYPIIEKDIFEQMFENIVEESNKTSLQSIFYKPLTKYTAHIEQYLRVIHDACLTPQARLPFMVEIN